MDRRGLRPLRARAEKDSLQNLCKQPPARTVWPWQDDLSQEGPRLRGQRQASRKVKWCLPEVCEDPIQESPAKCRKIEEPAQPMVAMKAKEEVMHGRLRWDEKDRRFLFAFKLADGKSVNFQTTCKAAGSKEAAERICRLCQEKFQTGASKSEVSAYRDELYKEACKADTPIKLEAQGEKNEGWPTEEPTKIKDCKGLGAHLFWCFAMEVLAGSTGPLPARRLQATLPRKVVWRAFRGAKHVLGAKADWEGIRAVWATQWWAQEHLPGVKRALASRGSRLHLADVAQLLAQFEATVRKERSSQAPTQGQMWALAAPGGQADATLAKPAATASGHAVPEAEADTKVGATAKSAGRQVVEDKGKKIKDRRGQAAEPPAAEATESKAKPKAPKEEQKGKAPPVAISTCKAAKAAQSKTKAKESADKVTVRTGKRASGKASTSIKDEDEQNNKVPRLRQKPEASEPPAVRCGVCGVAMESAGSCRDCTSMLSEKFALRYVVGDRVWCSGYGPRWPAKVEVIAFDNAEDTEPYCVSFYAEKTSAWVSEAKLMPWASTKPSRPAKRWHRRFNAALAAAEADSEPSGK
ncbi:unnamed protein product [Symbiodinium natans]|uniref:PWWP domain-containing protein n=1 Tax=Symbiodinium natans TaxID=878477 RepID=A0A812QRG1_9DINO|nr:unnamed protein product [Symbiodinium natans]